MVTDMKKCTIVQEICVVIFFCSLGKNCAKSYPDFLQQLFILLFHFFGVIFMTFDMSGNMSLKNPCSVAALLHGNFGSLVDFAEILTTFTLLY